MSLKLKMNDEIKNEIINLLNNNVAFSSKEIYEGLTVNTSYSTTKRLLSELIDENLITTIGKGKSTKYKISDTFQLIYQFDIQTYFQKEIDEREIKSNFNFDLINNTLYNNSLFTKSELNKLEKLQESFFKNIKELTDIEYIKEMERLAIDLSWKSSQIEGNTYSLLETEILLKDKLTASGKTQEEAIMLLNHKEAIDYIVKEKSILPISQNKIEFIHSFLVKDLNVTKNIRKRRVGITGTNYKPLDNEFQIKEALNEMCKLINKKENIFEKAFIALILISYIQPFMDGNKRTARIVSNAILIQNNYCPISFRTIDSIDYKKAMLLFYEQNNIYHFKNIFIDQFEFAVNNYF